LKHEKSEFTNINCRLPNSYDNVLAVWIQRTPTIDNSFNIYIHIAWWKVNKRCMLPFVEICPIRHLLSL